MYANGIVLAAYISFARSKFVSNPFMTITISSASSRPSAGSTMNAPYSPLAMCSASGRTWQW